MSIKRTGPKELAKAPEWVIDVDHASIAWYNQAASVLFFESGLNKECKNLSISVALRRRLINFLRALEKGPAKPISWTFLSVKGQYYDCYANIVLLGPKTYGIKVKAIKRHSLLRTQPRVDSQPFIEGRPLSRNQHRSSYLPEQLHNKSLAPNSAGKMGVFQLCVGEFSHLSLAVFDDKQNLVDASPLFHDTFVGLVHLKEIFALNSDLNKILEFIARVQSLSEGLTTQSWELRLSTNQGVRWHKLEVSYDRRQSKSYVSLLDVHKLREQENALFKLKNYDALTDLPNRHLLYQELELTLQTAQNNLTQFGVLYLDLDGFKVVNDSFGHRVGDELIVQVAKRLMTALPKGGRLFRLGGDEFALLQEGVTQIEELEVLAQNLMQVACAAYPIADMEMLITASIGIAHYPTHAQDVDSLLKLADVAMYRAKSIGHNSYKVYDSNMSQSLNAYLTLGGGLRRAIEKQEFELYYQPKINLLDQTTVGAEALIRWRHPEFGMISPDRFIPIAEETGLILPLGEWVIRTACKQLQEWRELGFPDMTVSVNLSGRQFMQADLVNMVHQVLIETGINPKNLELELTESMLMADADQTIEKLHGFRELGLSLSIDDFGTGYSSLAYLKKFPIQTLKIDRSFVRDLSSDLDDNAIVKATIVMASSLNLKVIAEGVETHTQLDVLKGYQCQEVQGFFFSKPMPRQEFNLYIARDAKSESQQEGIRALH